MAPSFISMLMAHNSSDKRSSLDSATITTTSEPSGVTLPHLVQGRSSRAEGLQFGLPGFQRSPFGQTHSGAAPTHIPVSSAHWNDRQKVQDFFRHTTSESPDENDSDHSDHATEDKKAAQNDDKAIDVRELVCRTVTELRESSGTLSTSSEDQQEESPDVVTDRGHLQSALENLLATQQQQEQDDEAEYIAAMKRRRYDSFDILADVRLDDEDSDNQMDDMDSVYSSTPARSRANSEDFFGGGLLDMLSLRHMPAGIDRHASVADMLANRALPTPNEDSDEEEQELIPSRPEESPQTGALLTESSTTDKDSRNKAPVNKKNVLETMLAKQACPSPPSPSKELAQMSKSTLLEAMLARRNTPSSPSETANPLAAISTRCQQEAGTTAEAVHPSDEKNAQEDQTPLKNHPTYQKYFKMLAVGLPVPVVKHKMQSESVDPSILDMDPNKPLPKDPAPALDEQSEAAYQAQLKEYEAKHGKYLQMVKVGLPTAVVEHKMRMDGLDPAWLQGPPKRPEPKPVVVSEVTPEERAAHRKKYHKYFQMLRMGLSRGAVEHKMKMAGVDPAELDGPRQAAKPAEQPKPTLKRKGSIRKKLHWEGKKHRTRRDSLWGGDNVDEEKEQVRISEESRAMLEKLFVKDLTKSKKCNASANAKDDAVAKKKTVMVQLIDMKKSQNIAITLARVKLSFPELKREILAMNSSVLSPSQVRSLMDMWPDRKEMEAITTFKGDLATIGTAEQFLMEVCSVPRFQERLACLLFKQEFPSRVQELRESLDVMTRGVYQVCSSAELRQLFIYILQIGNLLNFGGDEEHQGVDAFSLGSLVKFSQTKAFVGGTTFLQYVVQSIERDVPHLAHFYKDIDLIFKCSKVSYASLASEKNGLEAGLQKVLREAEASVPDDADKETMTVYNDTLMRFCKDVKLELYALQDLLDKLDTAKAHFLKYFEEEDSEEELDVLLSHIANFTSEYCREHDKYLANVKKDGNLCSKLSDAKSPGNVVQDSITSHVEPHDDAKAPLGQKGRHSKAAQPPQANHSRHMLITQ